MHIAFMAHNAGLMLDGVLRTFYRLFVSGRHLLEWRTAQQADTGGTASLWRHYLIMWFSVALARWSSPSASTTSTLSTLKQATPQAPEFQPKPPPSR